MDIVDMYIDFPHIGNEFLTWVWFKSETLKDFQFSIGNKIVFSKDKETVTIKGEESELIFGKVAMSDGFIVTEMQLVYSNEDPRFTFTMKGCDLSFNGLKMPKTSNSDDEDDVEGFILENIFLIEEVTSVVDKIFKKFILERANDAEWKITIQKIKDWINEG